MMQNIEQLYQYLQVRVMRGAMTVKINRPDAKNSIHTPLIEELLMVMTEAELHHEIKVVVLEGSADYFCTGMDFYAVSEGASEALMNDDPNKYYELLKRISLSSKIIISKVEGKVNAGGVGLVAASDIVIADKNVTFGLSEALFGLIPACVMPFLIRRIGYQKALWLTLITQGVSANRAFQLGLVDELTDNVNDTLRINLLRLTKLETETIKDLKDYMSKLWIINNETQNIAVGKIKSLINSDKVQFNIRNFVKNGKFPWDK
jgi:polyketide biosynthesis enoyl-CoA hydratase PksH